MEFTHRAVGLFLLTLSTSIFIYYTLWVVVTPFVDSDHFIHEYFLPRKYAILIPACAGVSLLAFLMVFIGTVMMGSKRSKAKST